MNVLRNYLGKLQLFYNKLISFNKLNYERKKNETYTCMYTIPITTMNGCLILMTH